MKHVFKPSLMTLLNLALAVVLLGLISGLILRAKHPKAASAVPSPTAAAYDGRIESPTSTYNLVFNGTTLESGPSAITVDKGAAVRVNISAKGKDEIHAELPDFGISTEAHATDNTPGGFSFVADKTGIFPFFVYTEQTDGTKPSAKQQAGTITVK